MPFSRLDRFYRKILLSKYFTKGWGNPDDLKRLLQFRKLVADRDTCYHLVPPDYPVDVMKKNENSDTILFEGNFDSPFELYLPGILPMEAKKAHFQMLLPKKWTSDHYKPICLHMAGTGDHYFWRRRHMMANPLLRESGIGSILLENPFYGLRKPIEQVRSVLHNVSDIIVMGGCLILEALVMFHWCLREGFGPLGVSGLSMGGHMASLAASNWPNPIILVPCLSWSTASSVFTEGVMSNAINWTMLEEQYKQDKVFNTEIRKMVHIVDHRVPRKDAFSAGKEFAKNFPTSMIQVNKVDYNLKGMHNFTGVKMEKDIKSAGQPNLETATHRKKPIIESFMNPSGGLFNFGLSDIISLKLFNFETNKINFRSLAERFLTTSKSEDFKWRQYEALDFMRGIMDECTHLRNFSTPVDTSLIIAFCAMDDGYVPRDSVTSLIDIWPGVEVRYLNGGHVYAFLLYQKVFRSAIAECFNRYKQKYIDKTS